VAAYKSGCVYVALFGSRQYAVTSPHTDVFYLAILTNVTLANTRNVLPDNDVTAPKHVALLMSILM